MAIIIHYLSISLAAIIFLMFVVTSIREKRPRAAIISFTFAIIIIATGIIIINVAESNSLALYVFPAFLIVVFLIFFVPTGTGRRIEITDNAEKVDERDTMFARAGYKPGTTKYDSYYKRHPELKDADDNLRKLPGLLSPDSKYYDAIRAEHIEAIFKTIASMTASVDGDISKNKIIESPEKFTHKIKNLVMQLDAVETGVAKLRQNHVYSHVGCGPEPYGSGIKNRHQNVIVFSVEMNYEKVEEAPRIDITEETARGYLKAAVISISLARHVRDMGYPARAHISDSNYQIMLPPVAYDAGIGEIGRHGYIISPTYGSRIRLGAVTTNLPLEIDNPINFGVQDFCDRCKRCAVNCPSAAIPDCAPETIRGVRKWPLNIEACFKYWCSIGTDCGLCMKVCPYSHPPSLIHNLVRVGIKNSAIARKISVYGEDLFYGKRVPFQKMNNL
ncbi:MAG: reductive dehalogenase domain-containing protein [candidate division Zixibacteria bacterium]